MIDYIDENETYEEDFIDDIEDEEELDDIEISRYSFNTYRWDRSIRDISNWLERNRIVVPDFQRAYIWSYNQACKFIESILLGLPIPDFFLFRKIEDKSDKYVLIDGLQRIKTIEMFSKGVYKKDGIEKPFKINIKNSPWKGVLYEKLSDDDKNFFDDYSLKFNIFDSNEKNESIQQNLMTSIFERINTGSTTLSSQEIRHAVYVGNATDKIVEYAQKPEFRELISYDKKYTKQRYDEELLLRIITYNFMYEKNNEGINEFQIEESKPIKFVSSKKESLNNFLFYVNKSKIDIEPTLKKVIKSMKILNDFDSSAFMAYNIKKAAIYPKVYEVIAEAISISLMKGIEISITKSEFDSFKKMIWTNPDKYMYFFEGTTSIDNVRLRVDFVSKVLSGEMHEWI